MTVEKRRFKRYEINCKGILYFHGVEYPVIIKDISTDGIGIAIDTNYYDNVVEMLDRDIEIQFYDYADGEKNLDNINIFTYQAIAVRMKWCGDYISLGCAARTRREFKKYIEYYFH